MNWSVATSTGGIPSRRIAARSLRNGVTLTRTSVARNARLFLARIVSSDRRDARARPASGAPGRPSAARNPTRTRNPSQRVEQLARRDAREADQEGQDSPSAARSRHQPTGVATTATTKARVATSLTRGVEPVERAVSLAVPLQELKPHPGATPVRRLAPATKARARPEPDPEDDQGPHQRPPAAVAALTSRRRAEDRQLVVGDRRGRARPAPRP